VILCFSLKPSSALPNKTHYSLPGSIWHRILGIGIVLLRFPGGGHLIASIHLKRMKRVSCSCGPRLISGSFPIARVYKSQSNFSLVNCSTSSLRTSQLFHA